MDEIIENVRKSVSFEDYELKCPNSSCDCDGKGYLKAVFATLGVIDKDGDIVHRGSIPSSAVALSSYQHQSWKGTLPVGKGKVYEDGNKAVFEGHFHLLSENSRDNYEWAKYAPELAEFSWGFNVTRYDFTKDDDHGLIMNIRNTEIFEVSPVLVGAGVNTGVMEVKARYIANENPQPLIEEKLLDGPEVVKARLFLAELTIPNL